MTDELTEAIGPVTRGLTEEYGELKAIPMVTSTIRKQLRRSGQLLKQ